MAFQMFSCSTLAACGSLIRSMREVRSCSSTLAHAKPWRIKPPHSATANGSQAAFGDQIGGFAWQLVALDASGLGEQVQRFRIGQQLDLMMHAAQRRKQTSVARGDHRSAARAKYVEPIDVFAAPNVVEDEEDCPYP